MCECVGGFKTMDDDNDDDDDKRHKYMFLTLSTHSHFLNYILVDEALGKIYCFFFVFDQSNLGMFSIASPLTRSLTRSFVRSSSSSRGVLHLHKQLGRADGD